MTKILQMFSSRKFWAAVGLSIIAASFQQYDMLYAIWAGWATLDTMAKAAYILGAKTDNGTK